MPKYAEGTVVEMPQYQVLLRELQKRTKDTKLISKKMATAMRYVVKPSLQALEANVARIGEDTGNLKKAVAIKVKAYAKSGNAVALVGFIRPGSSSNKTKGKGKDRAYHQGFLEFGTKQRFVKGDIASSYIKKGVFAIAKAGGSLKTSGYPKSFFKRGKKGQALSTGAMPIGGRSGRPPVSDAFNKTKGQLNQRLIDRTQKTIDSLDKALKKAAKL
jgi:hypothetical protein